MAQSNEKFNSIKELYERVLPALKTRVRELKRKSLEISEKDIWLYCVNNIWIGKKDLRIYEIVNDILNVPELNLAIYINKTRKEDNK